MNIIALGTVVKDPISGVVGTVVGRCEYLYCTPSLRIDPHEQKDGKPAEPVWLDESRVVTVQQQAGS